jgi:F0F1-type ATP synthase assembly protein I
MPDDPNPKPQGKLGHLVQAESAIQLALAIPVGCFVGLLLGAWLDRRFHTHWIVLAGMFLGAAGGFIQIFKAVSRLSKREDQ